MNRLFDKKPKKSLKSSQRHISLGIPTNIAAGPLGFRAELDIDPKDEKGVGASQIIFRDGKSEDHGLAVTDVLATGSTVSSIEHGSDPTSGDPAGTGKEKDGQAEASRVPEPDDKDTVLGAAPIPVNIAKEPTSGFGPLKAVLETISTVHSNHEETVAVRNKIEILLARVATLDALFATRPGDVVEQRRRNGLIRKLEGIEVQLRSLSEKPGLQQLTDHLQDDEEVSGILEDLQEAISDYQMIQQMALYKQGCKLIGTAEAFTLNNVRCAQEAEYRHCDRKCCLKGTRGSVLDGIELWTTNFDKPPVYWLNGLAGTGKTTIAQTIAESIFSNGQLGASFFCSRDFSDRSNLRLIFPTLAVQLARKYAKFRSIFVPLVQSDPGISQESLYNQMRELIVNPLRESAVSTVIVIDALDECKDEEPASAILSVLGQFVTEIPKVKFFLTGRPERRIREGFRLHLLAKATDVFVLHSVEPNLVKTDIRRFLSHSLLEIATRQSGLEDWPTEEQLDLLCKRAAGLFVYAVATVKFIDHRNNGPEEQLDRLLQSSESSAHEGKAELKENATLDSLYMSILQVAFGRDNPEDDSRIRSILGAVTLAVNPLSPFAIATLLGLSAESVFRRLSSVHSLLLLQDSNQPVRFFHKSFPDFIVDPTRCTNKRFYVSPSSHHMELLVGCLELMNRTLEKNMCNLPDAVTNSEVGDLRERSEQYIDSTLWYACKSWHRHLVDEHTVRTPKVISALHRFLEKKFLSWLEVLSVLGATREAVDALEMAAKWLEESPTLNLVNDCFRFVIGFFEIISNSAPHIYHSALQLSPKTSIVRELYEPHVRPLARIVQGLPTSWSPSITVHKPYANVCAVAWSPCSRFIAVAWDTSGTIEILDATTLDRFTILNSPLGHTRWLIFSPDGRLLTYLGGFPMKLISWDVETGAPVSTISPELQGPALERLSHAYSTCGTVLGVSFSSAKASTIHIYNVHSGVHTHSYSVGLGVPNIWAHDEHLRFVTSGPGSITTWEAGFASECPPTEIESLPTPNTFVPSKQFLFLPILSRLAFVLEKAVLVWDAQHSKLLLNSVDVKEPRRMTFSSDGRFFAYETYGPEIHLWKDSPDGYVLHQKFIYNAGGIRIGPGNPDSPLLSPNGQSIVVSSGLTIQLWRTVDPTAPCIPTQCTQAFQRTKQFILDFSPDKSLTAAARFTDNTATVFDLKSGVPRLIIDAGMEIYGLRVAGRTVAIVGDGKVVTWSLPPGDRVPDTRANVNDSVQTTMFDHSLAPTLEPSVSISPDFNYLAIAGVATWPDVSLNIYDLATGKHLASTESLADVPWFTPDGREVWCRAFPDEIQGWKIVKDSKSDVHKLEDLESTRHIPEECPWKTPHGYIVMDDGWILNSNEKRLLWLPPYLRSGKMSRVWGGRFLAFLHRELPEVVVLELLQESDS